MIVDVDAAWSRASAELVVVPPTLTPVATAGSLGMSMLQHVEVGTILP